MLIAVLLAATGGIPQGPRQVSAAEACGHVDTLLSMLALGDQVLVGSSGGAALVRSTDGGRCWTQAQVQPYVAHRLGAIVQDPEDPGVLLAGSGSTGGVAFGANLGLLRSADGGRSWQMEGAAQGLPATDFYASAFAVTPTALFVAISCAADLALIEAVQAGHFACARPIFRSLDHGKTWRPVGPGTGTVDPNVGAPPFDSSVLAMAAAGRTVYAIADPLVGAGGAYRSIDNGATWRLAAPSADLRDATTLIGLARPPGVLLAGVGIFSDSARILRSADQGRSWTTVLPTAVSQDTVIVGCAEVAAPQMVYCAGLHHLFSSADGGMDWSVAAGSGLGNQPIAAFTALPDGNLLAAEYGGLLVSRDGGDHWSQVP
jgi:photosystem II stability/assembly factor-like uncharacterized protein